MRIKAIVEKGSDGMFSIYSNQHLGNSYFGGFGDSVSKAKSDFEDSIREAIQEQLAEGAEAPAFESLSLEYRYDLPSFFNFFDFINVSKFAEYASTATCGMQKHADFVQAVISHHAHRIALWRLVIGEQVD